MDRTQEYRRDFLRKVHASLELLLQDAELMERGFQFFNVVDFAAISAYMYKETVPPFARIGGESNDRTYARSQMALHALFSMYPRPLLMIPPYWEEMRNDLRSLATSFRLAALDTAALHKEKFSRLINSSEQFQSFRKLRAPNDDKPAVAELRKAAIKVGREYFPELYACISFLLAKGQETLKMLLRNKVLTDAAEVIPECQGIDYSAANTDEWYKKIVRRRGGERAIQSFVDAKACSYIELANARLNPSRKIVVFVSPSGSVSAALAGRPLISLEGEGKMSVTRDLTYCQLASTHQYNRRMIGDSLATVARLLALYESPIPVEWWVEKREKAAEDWKHCENLFLMRTSSMTEMEDALEKGAKPLESQFLDVLRKLQSSSAEDEESYAQQLKSELLALHSEVTELIKTMPSPQAGEGYDLNQVIELDEGYKGLRIVLPGLFDELPTELFFTDRSMIRLARLFQRLKRGEYSEASLIDLRKLILDAASGPGSSTEHHLLAGYVLALEGRFEAALTELDAGWVRARKSKLVELSLACAMVHRKLEHGATACELLAHALVLEPDDPRLHVEMAKNLWLRWSKAADPISALPDLEDSLFHLRHIDRRSSYRVNEDMRAQIENVAAFVCTELAVHGRGNSHAYLEQAYEHLQRLEAVRPVDQWPGRFFDTRGYWLYAKAKCVTDDRMKRKELHEEAAADFVKALSPGKSTSGPGIRQEHKKLNDQAIAELATIGASHGMSRV